MSLSLCDNTVNMGFVSLPSNLFEEGKQYDRAGNLEAAVSCWEVAAQGNHPDCRAVYNLGLLYVYGKDRRDPPEELDSEVELEAEVAVPLDHERAAKYFQQGAELAHGDSIYQLGKCYLLGRGVDRGVGQALELFNKAASQKHAPSIHRMGEYRMGIISVRNSHMHVNPEAAFSLYMQAAEAGYAPSMGRVAEAYEGGVGAIKDIRLAAHWASMGANGGDALSQTILANCYETGRGVPIDDQLSFYWAYEAALQGWIELLLSFAEAFMDDARPLEEIEQATIEKTRQVVEALRELDVDSYADHNVPEKIRKLFECK